MFDLTPEKERLLGTDGNLLVVGGPGSGKTTIALLKARHEILNAALKPGQKVLFLSFARATITRVEEQLKNVDIDKETKKCLEINTYHGFLWEILKSHGYLISNFRRLTLLPPPDAASRLVEIDDKESEKRRLFHEEGLVHFDLFADLCAALLTESCSLCKLICDRFPIIILDEFQDTNSSEWEFIRTLGQHSRIIALADAEQRIYEFRGADPARISEYIKEFTPTTFDFGTENNRSNGTDIVQCGNDLLRGTIDRNAYNDVQCVLYTPFRGQSPHLQMKTEVLSALGRLNKEDSDWSLAILVPTKSLMLQVSDFLSSRQTFNGGRIYPEIKHEVALDQDALSLSAILIAGIMEQGDPDLEMIDRLVGHLNDYVRGRKGGAEKMSQKSAAISQALAIYLDSRVLRREKATIQECCRIARECSTLTFSGSPAEDWLAVRNVITASTCDTFMQLGQDAKYLKLLHKGSALQAGLSSLWRAQGNYIGAVNLVRNALLQEHFSKVTKVWNGVQVMTIHKAKGKEFDEVIIYEGIHRDRIVRMRDRTERDLQRSRILLRVAVTRAMKRATILTPSFDRCPLLS